MSENYCIFASSHTSKTSNHGEKRVVEAEGRNQDKNTTIEDITISKAEQNIDGATLVSENALDFTNVDDIKAYVATDANAGSVTFKQVKKVPANTPLYLTADDVVSVEVPVLDGSETTGISTAEVSTAKEDNVWYTLQGVRVAAPTKGIYVKNGKKVMVN